MSMRKTSRRHILTAGAAAIGATAVAAPVAGLPAIATAGDDQIFAAIERHKDAWRAFEACCHLTDAVLAKEERRKITDADKAAYQDARDAEEEALDAMIGTAPTTKAGARAALEWLIRYDAGCAPRAAGRFAATLLSSPLMAGEALS